VTGGAALVLGVGLGLAVLVGYAVLLLRRFRGLSADAPPGPRRPREPERRGRLGPRQRLAVLLAFTVVSTGGLLLAAEVACRAAGYGGYPSTFREYGAVGGGRRLVMTEHAGASSYFFADRSRPGSLSRDALLMPKPEGTFRVVVVGGSAAKGIPYPRHLSGASFLETMLGDLMPGREVEVINLGTTAIASYPVLGMLTESLGYEPDLAVVYCGNNEFYGAFGVASLHEAGRSPASIRFTRWARSLGITQLAESLRPGYDTEDDRTLMEALVGQGAIPYPDEIREAAARNLRTFVGDMIDRCASAGVPVIVCTPPANERGLAPIGADDLLSMEPAAREAFEGLLSEAERLIETDPAAAVGAAQRARDEAPSNARVNWVLGRAHDAAGDRDEAVRAYTRAIDADPMPWRAPPSSVEAIRGAIAGSGAVLCDLVAGFRAASPGGAIGWELMDDHVHPSLAGQALVGRSIALSVPDAVPGVGFTANDVRALPDDESYMRRLGATVYDRYVAARAMGVLGRIGFFERSNPGFAARFDDEAERIRADMAPEIASAVAAWESSGDGGIKRPITGDVAMALFSAGRYAEAEPLFAAAVRASEPWGTWELQYTSFMLTCRGAAKGSLDETDLALAAEMIGRGRFLIAGGYSTSGAAERYVGELHLLRGEHAEAVEWLTAARPRLGEDGRVAVDGALVRALVGAGRRAEAASVIERGLAAGGRYAPYYAQMRSMLD
jgi:tetratricopeptide (TPR) repeat protein